jgi:serine/threonine-protein kinase
MTATDGRDAAPPMSEPESRGSARIGTTIRDKYKIERLLGEGGMAVVYVAVHRNKKRFAIKMLHPELSIHADIRARFLKEGYVANTVEHPGAVAVLDDDVAEDGAAFLVMELLDGAPVDELARRSGSRLSVKATLSVTHQLLDVLAAAHEKGVVHRDLKPANLFVTKDGSVKVLDFGIARLREAAQGNSQATSSGMLLGTPAYMPPEQAMAQSSEIEARSDIWSVGATIFTLLSAEIVHLGENATQVAIAAATKPARSLTSVVPGADGDIVAIVDRALAFNKKDRWANARAMQTAVASAHRALFGHDVSRETLADLFRVPGAIPSSPTATVPLAGTPARQRRPSEDEIAKTERPSSSPKDVAGAPPFIGATTAQPLSNTLGSSAPPPPLHRSLAWVAVPVVAILVAGGVGAWGYLKHQGSSSASETTNSSSVVSSIAAETTTASTVPPANSAQAQRVVDASDSTTTVSSATATKVNPVAGPAKIQPPRPTTQETQPKLAPSATAPQPVAASSPASPQPNPTSTQPKQNNCDPPYWVDSEGKHYKPECLNK